MTPEVVLATKKNSCSGREERREVTSGVEGKVCACEGGRDEEGGREGEGGEEERKGEERKGEEGGREGEKHTSISKVTCVKFICTTHPVSTDLTLT